eukprot:Lithocolla_globosa_v1_NODE_5349_length_1257_cov_6.914309.p1 type:complete len:249 gc:universal NODE_5349_length_1257_cov_6.914309:141-887(+)
MQVHGPYLDYSKENPLPNKPEGSVRFVCHSDTHSRTSLPEFPAIPAGDVFVHCGDFTQDSLEGEYQKFSEFLKSLPHPTKVVIAGNHDTCCDLTYYNQNWNKIPGHKTALDPKVMKRYVQDVCVYLEDQPVEIQGIKAYGSPWTIGDWSFGLQDGKGKWDHIPEDISVLITHSPPQGILDERFGSHLGCPELLKRVKHTKPLVHVFGHVHEGRGVWSNQDTIFINCAAVNKFRKPKNLPVVFDITRPV